MPELPETETIARDLHEALAGARITGVEVYRADVLREVREEALATLITGATITRVWRRAKLVVLDLRGAAVSQSASAVAETVGVPVSAHLVVQPRFTGALLLDDGALPEDQRDYITLTIALADGRAMHYRDVRRLGTVAHMPASRFAEYSGTLGPEPLDAAFTNEEFSALVRASRRSIKTLLMDQTRLAGVGNIYANEALWRAGIDPSRIGASLALAESDRLLRELRDVLQRSIAARGTSFRDYRDARGQRGGFVAQLAVYGRGGQPCLQCGRRLIETHAVDGRTTVFCASCQH